MAKSRRRRLLTIPVLFVTRWRELASTTPIKVRNDLDDSKFHTFLRLLHIWARNSKDENCLGISYLWTTVSRDKSLGDSMCIWIHVRLQEKSLSQLEPLFLCHNHFTFAPILLIARNQKLLEWCTHCKSLHTSRIFLSHSTPHAVIKRSLRNCDHRAYWCSKVRRLVMRTWGSFLRILPCMLVISSNFIFLCI